MPISFINHPIGFVDLNSKTKLVPFSCFFASFLDKIQFVKYYSYNHYYLSLFGPALARSYKIGVVVNNWLVGNSVFSETALRIFLIFYIKLGDYKGTKVTKPDFWKKFLILEIFAKTSPIWLKIRCLVIFLQFAGLVNVFLFYKKSNKLIKLFCLHCSSENLWKIKWGEF